MHYIQLTITLYVTVIFIITAICIKPKTLLNVIPVYSRYKTKHHNNFLQICKLLSQLKTLKVPNCTSKAMPNISWKSSPS